MNRGISGAKRVELAKLIARYFSPATLSNVVTIAFDEQLANWGMGGDFHEVATGVVAKASLERRIDELIAALRATNPSANLHAALDALVPPPILSADGLSKVLLIETAPPVAMVNRVKLRQDVTQFFANTHGRILSVEGPEACGKTHSWRLVRRVADDMAIPRHRVDIGRFQPPVKVSAVLYDIVLGLNLDDEKYNRIVADNPTDNQAVSRFITWLGAVSQRFEGPCLLVIDGIDKRAAQDVRANLVPQLVAAVGQSEIANFYLVLLGDDARRVQGAGAVIHDAPSPLTRDDIKVFLTTFAGDANWALSTEALDALTDWVIGACQFPFTHQAFADAGERLNKLIDALRGPAKDQAELLKVLT